MINTFHAQFDFSSRVKTNYLNVNLLSIFCNRCNLLNPFLTQLADGTRPLVTRDFTRTKLEELTRPLLERTLEMCASCLEDSGLVVEVLGISKERDADSPTARVKPGGGLKAERIFRPGRANPIIGRTSLMR